MKLLLAATTVALASAATYKLESDRTSCAIPITSKSECEAAAVALGLDDIEARTRQKQRNDPPGCYIEQGNELQFNEDGSNENVCGQNSDVCLCIDDANAVDPVDNTQFNSGDGFVIAESNAECTQRIVTQAECSEASFVLGFSSTVFMDNVAAPNDPPGCYFEGGRVFVNAQETNSGDCSAEDKCLCIAAGGITTRPPTNAPPTNAPPTNAPVAAPVAAAAPGATPPPTSVEVYKIVSDANSACEPIATLEECQVAILILNDADFQDTRASEDNGARSSDPTGCYVEKGNLKFNSNGNTGACGAKDDVCVCKGADYTAPQEYVLVESDVPCVGVNDAFECAIAAASLGLKDHTVDLDNGAGRDSDPEGCYFESNKLKYNGDNTNTGKCGAEDSCLCVKFGFGLDSSSDDDSQVDETPPVDETPLAGPWDVEHCFAIVAPACKSKMYEGFCCNAVNWDAQCDNDVKRDIGLGLLEDVCAKKDSSTN